ncbi:hypothetical protein D6T64_01450 [Cryobacterium melibiosiphilum]|uniref:Uncharacterized protein n=1 Tax=Cryobacterium melibiosiphilum TaxID=995039 RepID=A0A3A5MNJ0_9MICO|nr:hypothetical protein [Cryobacterium melibiosiphilum]RJT91657.1 hypothetical protein D6T64_01450 [Cryobacterium melibiosiphilum]
MSVVDDSVLPMPSELSTLSPTRVRQLRILSAISELGGGTSGSITHEAIAKRIEAENDLGVIALADHLELLKDEGLVALELRLGGVIASVNVLPSGQAAVEEFEHVRASIPVRRRQLRDDYLAWLYNQIEVLDIDPTPDAYLRTVPSFMGFSYTAKDLEKTGEWLVTNGFIQGEAAWQYAGPLRPTLTAKGSFTIENGRSSNDPPPAIGDTFHTTVNGPANVAQGSSHVRQNLSVEFKAEGLRLIDAIEQTLPALAAELSAAVEEQLNEARIELSGTAEVSKLKAVFGAMSGFLSQTSAGALGGLLTTQIAQFLATLP